MGSLMTAELMEARHADLLREARQARRVAAARRTGAIQPSAWRRRVGARLIHFGESLSGRPSITTSTLRM